MFKMVFYIVGEIDMTEVYPLSCIQPPYRGMYQQWALKTIFLRKILEEDKEEMDMMFENCKGPGFFNPNLKDHPFGLELSREVVDCVAVARALLPALPMHEKQKIKNQRFYWHFPQRLRYKRGAA